MSAASLAPPFMHFKQNHETITNETQTPNTYIVSEDADNLNLTILCGDWKYVTYTTTIRKSTNALQCFP